jgi:8-oxo-dGTP pyrophosphatase MutT (NUDIX family)
MLIATSRRVLMMHRVDGEGWALPAGGIKQGEDVKAGAIRETWEETSYRCDPNSVAQLMRRIKGGTDCVTFSCPVDSEFEPRLNHEHDQFAWLLPKQVLASVKADKAFEAELAEPWSG